MRKFYLFLMMLFVQLITATVSAQTDEEYSAALAAIGEDGYYYVTTNYAGVKYYLTADGTLTSAIDNACLFDFTRSDGGEFKAFGYLLDGGVGNYFSNPVSSGSINDTKLNTHTISGYRKTWEAQVFFMNNEGKFAVRATNAAAPAQNATSGWNWCGSSFWTVKVNGSTPTAGYSFDVNYIWVLEDEDGNEIEPPTDVAKVYAELNSVLVKYDAQLWDDEEGYSLNIGTEYGQRSDVDSWLELFNLLWEIYDICNNIDQEVYEWLGDGECPTLEEAQAMATKADELYNKILESVVQYTMPQDGYYRIITNLLYATKDTNPETGDPIFVEKAISASYSADHKNKAVYATLDRNKANFLWKLTKSETGDSIMIQNAGMGTYISFASPKENRVVMTENVADASHVMFDYAGLDFVENVEKLGDGDDIDVFYIRLASQKRDGSNYVHQLGHSYIENVGTILGHAGKDQGTEMELSFWAPTFEKTNTDRGTSEWYLEYVDDAEAEELIENFEMIRNHDVLVAQNKELRANVLEALTTAKDAIKTKMITSSSQLSSPYSDSSEGQHLEYLIDGDKSTFWHTDYHNNSPEGMWYFDGENDIECHYVQISGMKNLVGNCELYLCERSNSDNDIPSKIVLMGSNELNEEDPDAVEWEEIAVMTVPNTGKGEESTIPFTINTSYEYIRVLVTNTAYATYPFRKYWHAAEIQLYTVEENPNSQFAALGDVAKNLDKIYNQNLNTPDDEITYEIYQTLLDAYKAFLAAMVDPTELRTAMETYANVTSGVVEGEGPGLWTSTEIAEEYEALRAEIAAYDKTGIYNATQNHKYAVMLKAMNKSVMEKANGVKTDKWYHIMFPTEEMFTDYGFEPNKVGGDSKIVGDPNQWGYYVVSGIRTDEKGTNEEGEEVSTGNYYLEFVGKEDVREGMSMYFANPDDIVDPDVSKFRFVELKADEDDYSSLFTEMKENMLMALDMSTTYTKGEALITDASQLSTNAPDKSEGLHIEYAVDGNPNTFWHSDYHKEYLEPAYLQVALNKPVSGLIQVNITRRNNGYGHIVRMYIQGSNDAETWTNVGYLEAPYGGTPGESITCQPVDLGGTYKHLRFILTKRAGKDYEYDPFAVIPSADKYDQNDPEGWTYFHVAEFQIYPVTADKGLTASGKMLRNAYTTLNKIILKDATARDVTSASQAYRNYRLDFNAAEGKDVLPYGKDKADPVYAIQNKATGLFVNCKGSNNANNSLETIPTLFEYTAPGFQRSFLHGKKIDGGDCSYLHSQNFDHRFVTWNDTQVDYNSALVIVEADEEYAAPKSYVFYKDIKPGRIADWCNSVSITPVDAPDDAFAYAPVGQYTIGEDENTEIFLALKSIETIPAGQPALYIYGDTTTYDAEDDYVETIKFTIPGSEKPVVESATVNGLIGTLVTYTLDKYQIYFNGNSVASPTEATVSVTPCSAVLDLEKCPQVDPDASYDFSISLGKAGRDVADGVKDIPAAIEKVSQPGNVYSMDGKLLRSGATLNSLKAMGKGIYIFNGVKVVVK